MESTTPDRTTTSSDRSDESLAFDFRIGGSDFTALSDGFVTAPSKLLAPEVPEADLVRFHEEGGRHFRPTFENPINCLLARDFGDHGDVLVDAGYGTLPGPTGKPNPTAGRLPEALVAAGVSPADVRTVLVSHIHPDHVGGLFTDDGRPRFPNATYHVSREEVDFWTGPDPDLTSTLMPPPKRGEVVQTARLFIDRAGDRLHVFAAGSQAIEGVDTILLAGHTPGQVGFVFKAGDDTLFYTADAAGDPHISFQRPDWRFSFDTDSPLAVRTRRSLIDLLLDTGWYSFTPHFPWPGYGRLVRSGADLVWRAGA